jgi:hypothetical protein
MPEAPAAEVCSQFLQLALHTRRSSRCTVAGASMTECRATRTISVYVVHLMGIQRLSALNRQPDYGRLNANSATTPQRRSARSHGGRHPPRAPCNAAPRCPHTRAGPPPPARATTAPPRWPTSRPTTSSTLTIRGPSPLRSHWSRTPSCSPACRSRFTTPPSSPPPPPPASRPPRQAAPRLVRPPGQQRPAARAPSPPRAAGWKLHGSCGPLKRRRAAIPFV